MADDGGRFTGDTTNKIGTENAIFNMIVDVLADTLERASDAHLVAAFSRIDIRKVRRIHRVSAGWCTPWDE